MKVRYGTLVLLSKRLNSDASHYYFDFVRGYNWEDLGTLIPDLITARAATLTPGIIVLIDPTAHYSTTKPDPSTKRSLL